MNKVNNSYLEQEVQFQNRYFSAGTTRFSAKVVHCVGELIHYHRAVFYKQFYFLAQKRDKK